MNWRLSKLRLLSFLSFSFPEALEFFHHFSSSFVLSSIINFETRFEFYELPNLDDKEGLKNLGRHAILTSNSWRVKC